MATVFWNSRFGFGISNRFVIGFRAGSFSLALNVVDFFVDHVEVRIVVPSVIHDRAIFDFDNARRHSLHEVPIMRGEDNGPFVFNECVR